MHMARAALRFGRLNGRDFHDYRQSAGPDIVDPGIRLAWGRLRACRGDSEREAIFAPCVHRHMDDSEIFRDYTLLDYETGGVIDFDPPEAVARCAHEESVEHVARQMLGAALAANDPAALAFLFGKLYRSEAAPAFERLHAHALMHFGSAALIAAAIADGRLQPAHLACYREVSEDDDIVSRILREGQRADPRLRQALAAIDAAAALDWEAPCSGWPDVGPTPMPCLRELAVEKDLHPGRGSSRAYWMASR